MDILLLRRLDAPDDSSDAEVLRGLWPHIAHDAVVEYKSPAAGYRSRDLATLLGYGAQYFAAETERLREPVDLTLVLAVPACTPLLEREAAALGWLLAGERGYIRATGGAFALWIVELAEVANDERDAVVAALGGGAIEPGRASRWWYDYVMQPRQADSVPIENLEGFDEVVKTFLATLSPEQRLVGLSAEQLALSLPVEMLRALDPAYLATLPAEVQAAITRKLAG